MCQAFLFFLVNNDTKKIGCLARAYSYFGLLGDSSVFDTQVWQVACAMLPPRDITRKRRRNKAVIRTKEDLVDEADDTTTTTAASSEEESEKPTTRQTTTRRPRKVKSRHHRQCGILSKKKRRKLLPGNSVVFSSSRVGPEFQVSHLPEPKSKPRPKHDTETETKSDDNKQHDDALILKLRRVRDSKLPSVLVDKEDGRDFTWAISSSATATATATTVDDSSSLLDGIRVSDEEAAASALSKDSKAILTRSRNVCAFRPLPRAAKANGFQLFANGIAYPVGPEKGWTRWFAETATILIVPPTLQDSVHLASMMELPRL